MPVELTIDRIEPERLFSFRWHPFAIEKDVDYSREPTTLIEFTLEEVAEKLCIKLTTARSQLAIIFSKAGIRRQTKLVAILSRIAHLERRAAEAA